MKTRTQDAPAKVRPGTLARTLVRQSEKEGRRKKEG
jgi:hypothetical protein